MQIIHRILAGILILTGLLATVIGITTPGETTIVHTEVIRSPSSVIWPVLADPERMPSWQTGMVRVTPEKRGGLEEGMILKCYTHRYDPGLFHEERVIRVNPEKNLTLMRVRSEQNTVLRDFSQIYELKRLLDGTTELTYRIYYRCPGFISRIYNRLYQEKYISTRGREDIRRLKALIEKI